MDFKTVESAVRFLLVEYEPTKSDDMILYMEYVNFKGARFTKAALDREYRIKHGIASYETVSRVRRRLQAKYKELRPTPEYMAERKRAEKEYRKYARGKGV